MIAVVRAPRCWMIDIGTSSVLDSFVLKGGRTLLVWLPNAIITICGGRGGTAWTTVNAAVPRPFVYFRIGAPRDIMVST